MNNNIHTLSFQDFLNESSYFGEVDREKYRKLYAEIKRLYPNVYSVLFDKNGDFSPYVGFSSILDVIVNNEKYWVVTRISFETLKPLTGSKTEKIEDLCVVVADKKEFDKYKDDSLFPQRYIEYRSRYPEAMVDTVTTLKELKKPAKINFNKQ